MSLPLLALLVMAGLALGYHFYGGFISRQYHLEDSRETPAERLNDNVDFVPAKPFYLLGQHFSAIAAAGPIAGPILACQAFGWLPCILWIGLGVIFIGAVHDFSALVASVRHEAKSIAEIVRQNLGPRAWGAMMAFIWIAIVYVIVAFTDVTASTFIGITEEFEGRPGLVELFPGSAEDGERFSRNSVEGGFAFNPGGAVAASSVMYLLLSILMGLIQRRWNPPLVALTLIFVPATLGVVWLGTQISTLLIFSQKTWGAWILIYCFIASLLPLWALLQPRGYLGGFVLYLVLFVGVVGIFFGGFEIHQPAFKGWSGANMTDALFPFLFVTIACGACSGFHGLVCSGTTSRQISKESHCRSIGYGGMLLEGFVALIALATIMMLAQSGKMAGPGKVYGDGIGRFLTVLIGEKHLLFAMTFGAMAFSTFVFDTLDVATRLGRYILQELFGLEGKRGAILATALTVAVPFALIMTSSPGSYRLFWTLFGTSNQLLAALTLLGITVWLKRTGRKYWFTLLPMLFVMTITVWSLLIQASALFKTATLTQTMNGGVSVVFIALAGFLVAESIRAWRTDTAVGRRLYE